MSNQIKDKKLLDIYGDISKSDIYVTRMVLKVNQNGDVEVVEAEYQEVVEAS